MGKRRVSPEVVAAVVNGVVTLIVPMAIIGFLSIVRRYDRYNDSTTVHASNWSPVLTAAGTFLTTVVFVSPLALLAGWRTWVHARRWRSGGRGWQGVEEAGVSGLAVAILALLVLLPRITAGALPYVLVYCGLGLVVGLVVGLLLLVTARVILALTLDI